MRSFELSIRPQYVRQTNAEAVFGNGKKGYLHEIQRVFKEEFDDLPTFTIITAPTGTGKSYAFPFPVLEAKQRPQKPFTADHDCVGLVVLPTNALIEELAKNFRETYPQLKVEVINRARLNATGKKGFDRLKAILAIAGASDLVITNPDIINYTMHGGYHKFAFKQHTGRKEFHNLLECFDYLIFDEYHLYDEAQIANILTLAYLRDLILGENNRLKYIFTSATPEPKLKELLERNFGAEEVREIVEKIVDEPTQARAIHGKLEVLFYWSNSFADAIETQLDTIAQELAEGRKALIIFDQLREVHTWEAKLKQHFALAPHEIYASTGYAPKEEDNQASIKQARLILATNKAEVGVNYEVQYCLMQPGKFYQNFVQRFGRVARGDEVGKVVICLDNAHQYKALARELKGKTMAYYDFVNTLATHLRHQAFYEKRVPQYLGEYMWCIRHSIRHHQSYHTNRRLQDRLDNTDFFTHSRYGLLQQINGLIKELLADALGTPPEKLKSSSVAQILADNDKRLPESTRQWAAWWGHYLDTYLSFRDGSMVVKIIDQALDLVLDYSLDWILQHKEIVEVRQLDEATPPTIEYVVGRLKERDKELQYDIATIPAVHALGNRLVSYREKWQIQKKFQEGVARIEAQLKKKDLSSHHVQIQLKLVDKLRLLSITYDAHRVKIESIASDEPLL
ncbi:type I-D CRISPR-associated helicase Cas3' [marine bacterium AO1-C]|nr:type I-D CRISPR-associated helicase Cas3' [marine bacterium AO1-C]